MSEKKKLTIITGIAIIAAFHCMGEIVSHFFTSKIPGSLIGLLLLIVFCSATQRHHQLNPAAQFIIQLLPLLLVPTCVRGLLYVKQLTDAFWPLFFGIVVSTIVAMFLAILICKRIQTYAAPNK